jgi:prepilin-type N-terminal cleavage/methylation domain-containing protein
MEVNHGMFKRIKGFTLIELLIVIAIILILIAIALPNFLEAQIRARVTKANGELRSLSTACFDYNTALISASKEGIFPPGGGVAQNGWKPWTDAITSIPENGGSDGMHACSVIWVSGSFFSKANDATSTVAAPTVANHFDLRVMTSPIEALTSIPLDPFKNDGGFNAQYDYFGVNLRDTFVFRSLGPDGVAQVGCEAGGFRCKTCKSSSTSATTACVDKSEAWKTTPPDQFCLAAQAKGCRSLTDALRIGICVYSPTNGTKSSGDLWRTAE